jgi:hypothetical protein
MAKGRSFKGTNGIVAGPYNGRAMFNFGGTRIIVSASVAKTISGDIPDILMMLPKKAVAMAMQSALEVFLHTKDILVAIQELFVCAEELRLGLSILTTERYCKCHDDACRDTEMHHCMYCLRVFPCASLVWTSDDHLICRSHFKNGPPTMSSYIRNRVRAKSWCCENHEGMSLEHRKKIQEFLTTEDWISDTDYRDVYYGQRPEHLARHPLQMSLEAIYPLYKADGKFFIHHWKNVGLTAEILNRFKCDDLPIILAAAGDSVKRKGANKYLPDIELIFDHLFMIRCLIPRGRKVRKALSSEVSHTWWKRFEAMMKSGVYDGCRPAKNYTFKTTLAAREDFWDAQTIRRINRICQEIENSAVYNPQRLKLPRGKQRSGLPGAPFIWNPSHMFTDHSWHFLASMFKSRFERMDDMCDWVNDHTQESPETLFLTCVVLWFQLDGGKDELLGLRMTAFVRHPLRFSIGRALHVAPGSIMRTGWTKRFA